MAPKKPRPRAERRLLARALRKEVREREDLVRLAPGGAPDRPITLETSALVEATARSLGCHQCAGELTVEEHAAESCGPELLRRVRGVCRRCGAVRTAWFRLLPRAPH